MMKHPLKNNKEINKLLYLEEELQHRIFKYSKL